MATRGALCWLVIALLLDSNSSTETAPKNPFNAPIRMACQKLSGVMQTTARTICEQKDSLNVFSILLSKVIRGDTDFKTSTQSACQILVSGENKEQCSALLRLKNLYKGMKTILDASGKAYTNRFAEDRYMIFDRSNLAIFTEGLDSLPDMESSSTIQLLHALLETALENRAQLRLARIQLLEFQGKFFAISVVGMAITLVLVTSYLLIALYYIYKYIVKCNAKREENTDRQEMERFSRLMRHYRIREQEEVLNEQALLPIE